MLQHVTVGQWSLDGYEGIVPAPILAELREHARALAGARLLTVNATAYGGGVSELLRSGVPLLRDLGLDVDWKVIGGSPEFFAATKALHNALQGSERGFGASEQEAYRSSLRANARELDGDYDFVIVHDPQPAGLLAEHGKGGARWVWRCHLDTSEPNPEGWSFMRSLLEGYDAAVFTMDEFVPPDFPLARVETIPPAIDPLSPKNIELQERVATHILDWIGVRVPGRLITQVSRFDAWKDPLGVIEAYRLVREEVPELQLALAGSMALDDPEGWEVYSQVSDSAAGDPQIHLYTNLTGVGNVEVNAFQRLSEVVVQKSIREGFGLVVSEALWKGTPVVAGDAGGIPLQMPGAPSACSSTTPRAARGRCWSCWETASWRGSSDAAAASTCASASCCRACCATNCACCATSPARRCRGELRHAARDRPRGARRPAAGPVPAPLRAGRRG